MTAATDPLLYLDRVKSLYPGGIARNLIEQSVGCAVLFVASPDSLNASTPLAGAGGELLKAAIVKGLEVDLSKVAVVVFEGKERLSKRVEELSPGMLFLLGEKVAQALLGVSQPLDQLRTGAFLFSQIPTIVSFDPCDVAATPDLKRGFWEDLKKVKAALHAIL